MTQMSADTLLEMRVARLRGVAARSLEQEDELIFLEEYLRWKNQRGREKHEAAQAKKRVSQGEAAVATESKLTE